MFKIIFTILLLFFLSSVRSEHQLQFKSSPVGNLIYQLDCFAEIRGFRCSQASFEALWKQPDMAQESDFKMIKKWKSLRELVSKEIEIFNSPEPNFRLMPNYPLSDGHGFNLQNQLRAMAFDVDTLSDYQHQLALFLPQKYVDREMEVIRHFWPRFDTWYQQRKADLQRFESEIVELAETIDVSQILTHMRSFYNSLLPKDMIFPVYLIAHPQEQAHSSATLFGKHSFVEVMLNEQAKYRMGVVIHEIAHYYYSAAPVEFHENLMNQLLDKDPLLGKISYYLINEALAAAIGNGMVEKNLRSAENFKKYQEYPLSFYSVMEIDMASKSVMPLVESYMNKNLSIDNDFIVRMMEIWKQSLKTVVLDPRSRFKHLGMVILDETLSSASNDFFQHLQPSSFSIYSPRDGEMEEEISLLKKDSATDTIILATEKSQIEALELEQKLKLYLMKELETKSLVKVDQGSRFLIVILSDTSEPVWKLFESQAL